MIHMLEAMERFLQILILQDLFPLMEACLLYTSDAADERSSVDLGGRRIIKKKNTRQQLYTRAHEQALNTH